MASPPKLSDRLLSVLKSFLTEKDSTDKIAVGRLLQLGLIQKRKREQGYVPTKFGCEELIRSVERSADAQREELIRRLERRDCPHPILSDDEKLAVEFIVGRVLRDTRTDKAAFKLLPLDGARLREAQAALVRVLRAGSPPSQILWGLSGLLDHEHQSQSRKLVLRRRSGGRKEPNYSRDIAIAMDVEVAIAHSARRRGSRAHAINNAMDRYGVDQQTVERALKKHGHVWRNVSWNTDK